MYLTIETFRSNSTLPHCGIELGQRQRSPFVDDGWSFSGCMFAIIGVFFFSFLEYANLFVKDSRQAHFEFRRQCYDLVFKVIEAVDNRAASDPGVMDGQYTLIAKRRNESYGVISDSNDEVFLTSLYDWYLEQGWNDRLLETQSPFVVTYLERKSADDIFHADLLWKYYGQSERYFEAAKVQCKLALSAFALSLSQRIEYLGQARANASTFTHDVGRQSRQKLLQEITNLMDVANIQDDLLQRLKEDRRISAEQKGEVMKEIDGPIMEISLVCIP